MYATNSKESFENEEEEEKNEILSVLSIFIEWVEIDLTPTFFIQRLSPFVYTLSLSANYVL